MSSRSFKRSHLLLALTMLAGCTPVGVGNVSQEKASLQVSAVIKDGSYVTQAVVPTYTASSIHHVIIQVFEVDAGVETPALDAGGEPLVRDIPRSQLDKVLTLDNLKPGGTYRLKAQAYADAETASLISIPAASMQGVTLSKGEVMTKTSLPIWLRDVSFNGKASGSIEVLPGSLASAGTPSARGLWTVSTLSGVPSNRRADNVVVDSKGNVYWTSHGYHAVFKLTPDGVFSILAGHESFAGAVDAAGVAARFYHPTGLAVDAHDTLYVADSFNQTIRTISSGGVVSTLAGKATTSGTANGAASEARFYGPDDVAVDGQGNVYVADMYNHVIRKISSEGEVSTFAGVMGNPSVFYRPWGVAVDASGHVYVLSTGWDQIWKVTPEGTVGVLAGAGPRGGQDGSAGTATFNTPWGLTVDGPGNVYVADTDNHTIRMISAGGMVTTLAGTPASSGSIDAVGSAARFDRPYDVAVDSRGRLYVADTENKAIRVLK
jgi:sugar lactone lactonase YvrE